MERGGDTEMGSGGDTGPELRRKAVETGLSLLSCLRVSLSPILLVWSNASRPSRQIFLLAALFAAMSGTAAAQDKIQRWHDNLERGAKAARESGKPLFVVFRCVR